MFPRQPQPEWMDAADVNRAELQQSLRYIERVNRWLGYTRATISHLDRFSRNWKRGQTITLLDIATGSADVPRAILQWGDRHGFDLRIVGVDRHPTTLELARREVHDPRITLIQGDAMSLPFPDQSFDYVLTSMFLHHLSETDVVRVLQEMNRLSRRGVIAADLLRNRRALLWIRLFTLYSNPLVKHDARVSVRQAFNRPEIESLRDRAGLGFADYHRHFGHRFVLAGEKKKSQ